MANLLYKSPSPYFNSWAEDDDDDVDEEITPMKPQHGSGRFKIIRPYVPPAADVLEKAADERRKKENAQAKMAATLAKAQERRKGTALSELESFLETKGLTPPTLPAQPKKRMTTGITGQGQHAVEQYNYKSSKFNQNGKIYTVVVNPDDTMYCDCIRWAIPKKSGAANSCTHTDQTQAKLPHRKLVNRK